MNTPDLEGQWNQLWKPANCWSGPRGLMEKEVIQQRYAVLWVLFPCHQPKWPFSLQHHFQIWENRQTGQLGKKKPRKGFIQKSAQRGSLKLNRQRSRLLKAPIHIHLLPEDFECCPRKLQLASLYCRIKLSLHTVIGCLARRKGSVNGISNHVQEVQNTCCRFRMEMGDINGSDC